MTAIISATLAKPAVAAIAGDSKTVRSSMAVRITGLLDADTGGSIVLGKSASAPATYAGLANPTTPALLNTSNDDWASFTASTPDNFATWSVTMSELLPLANAAWAPGDHVYVCLFSSASPAGGDVPLAVAGPFTVLA